jgi:O-antigen/teichoic acid export membrane protein
MSSDELTTIAQKATRGGLFLFIGNASSTVILAVGAILVARLLGPFNYGLYTLTVAIPVLLVALADAGINFALVRLPARLRSEGDHARANRLVKLGFLLKLVISTAASIVCYAGSSVIAPSSSSCIVYGLL